MPSFLVAVLDRSKTDSGNVRCAGKYGQKKFLSNDYQRILEHTREFRKRRVEWRKP